MTPHCSITGARDEQYLLRNAIVVVLVVLCSLLTLFPQYYRSAVVLTTSGPSIFGLKGTRRQLHDRTSMFGNQGAAVEDSSRWANLRVIERRFVHTTPQIGFSFAELGNLIAILGVAIV